MSIFDLFDDSNLPGDKSQRHLREGATEYEHFKQDAEGGEIFKKESGPLWVAYVICLVVFGILIGQLLNLQVTQGNSNRVLAEGNRIRAREINPPRGLILDSNKKVLAKNSATFSLEIYPLDLPKNKADRTAIYETLAGVAQIPVADIESAIAKKGLLTYDPVILKENLDRDTALILKVKTADLAGVGIAADPVRQYENIPGLAGLLGYVGKVSDRDLKNNPNYKSSYEIGKDGLESFYEKYLRGVPGVSQIEVDSKGRQQRELASTQPMPGNNLILNVDSGLEQVLSNSLSGMMTSSKATGGVAVAMNPQTGQILGMVSLPSYDNNLFTRPTAAEEYQKLLNDPTLPLFDRTIAGTYPSGSIIKPVMASMALQEGEITPTTTINDPGEIKVGSYTYPDWKAHGNVDVKKAIAESCDVFFYAVAGGWDKIKGLGVDTIDKYLSKFGFGQKTGIDLPGEVTGLVPNPKWKQQVKNESWYLGDTYHLGIGQGDFLVTPLQMVVATSVIANGGQLLQPKIVSQITDKDGNVIETFPKEVVRENFIDPANISTVKAGMRQAGTSGSAKSLSDLPVEVAAKTGTAQFEIAGKTHAWMTAYAPYNNPTFAIAVLIEQGGEGYAEAGPVVHDALKWYFSR
jgi:penicillin-binding protein 2